MFYFIIFSIQSAPEVFSTKHSTILPKPFCYIEYKTVGSKTEWITSSLIPWVHFNLLQRHVKLFYGRSTRTDSPVSFYRPQRPFTVIERRSTKTIMRFSRFFFVDNILGFKRCSVTTSLLVIWGLKNTTTFCGAISNIHISSNHPIKKEVGMSAS